MIYPTNEHIDDNAVDVFSRIVMDDHIGSWLFLFISCWTYDGIIIIIFVVLTCPFVVMMMTAANNHLITTSTIYSLRALTTGWCVDDCSDRDGVSSSTLMIVGNNNDSIIMKCQFRVLLFCFFCVSLLSILLLGGMACITLIMMLATTS